MKFLTNLTNKQITIIAVIFILALAFYWYEWRPSQIRSNCYSFSAEKARDFLKTRAELPGGHQYETSVEKGLFLREDQEGYYQNCLREKGL